MEFYSSEVRFSIFLENLYGIIVAEVAALKSDLFCFDWSVFKQGGFNALP